MTARKPQFFDVPPAVVGRPCRACGVTIYLVSLASGRYMPVTCAPAGCFPPQGGRPGRGLSHYADCTQPQRFRRS